MNNSNNVPINSQEVNSDFLNLYLNEPPSEKDFEDLDQYLFDDVQVFDIDLSKDNISTRAEATICNPMSTSSELTTLNSTINEPIPSTSRGVINNHTAPSTNTQQINHSCNLQNTPNTSQNSSNSVVIPSDRGSKDINKYNDFVRSARLNMDRLKKNIKKMSIELETCINYTNQILKQPKQDKNIVMVHFLSERINFTLPVLAVNFTTNVNYKNLHHLVALTLKQINMPTKFSLTYRKPVKCQGQLNVICIIDFVKS